MHSFSTWLACMLLVLAPQELGLTRVRVSFLHAQTSILPRRSQSPSHIVLVCSIATTCIRSRQHILGSMMNVFRQEEVHTFLNSRAASSSFTSAGG